MRRIAFGLGFALALVAGVVWTFAPNDPLRLGLFAGACTGLINVGMLWSRRDSVSSLGIRGAVRWVRVNFVSRMAVLLLVLVLLGRRLGTSGDLALLGGFFAVEAAVLAVLVREKG